MRRLHPDAAVVVTALLGVAALHATALALEPPAVRLADVPAREGARVAVEGIVLREGRMLVLAQDGTRLPVLAPREGMAARGDLVRAVGLVTRFDDGPGVGAERVEVLRVAATRPLLPSDLASSPRDHEGARVLVRGEVRDGAIVGGGARVHLAGATPPEPRGVWLATGDFAYDRDHARYVLRVVAWSRPS